MGQYYIVANIDKKEYMRSNGGVKLMEWSYNRNPLVLNLMKKLANEWKNDRVFVAGDYALSKDRIDKDKNPIEKDYDYEILEKIEKELSKKDSEIKKLSEENASLKKKIDELEKGGSTDGTNDKDTEGGSGASKGKKS